MSNDRKPLIIVLAGTYGVGKTTLAHQLGIDLNIMQKTTTSTVTQTVRRLMPHNKTVRNWFRYDKTDKDSVRIKLKREADLIGKAFRAIVDHAEYAGENNIIEGVQLFPEFLPMEKILFFYVSVSLNNKHKIRFNQPNITRLRHVTHTSYALAKKVDEIIFDECRGYPIHRIDNVGTPKQASKQIINIIKKTHPNYKNEYLWFGKN